MGDRTKMKLPLSGYQGIMSNVTASRLTRYFFVVGEIVVVVVVVNFGVGLFVRPTTTSITRRAESRLSDQSQVKRSYVTFCEYFYQGPMLTKPLYSTAITPRPNVPETRAHAFVVFHAYDTSFGSLVLC